MKLWKFMDLTKFLNLVLTNQLHFLRIDSFRDTYEGHDNFFYEEALKPLIDADLFSKSDSKKLSAAIKSNCYVSCWHINEYESAAMWDLYANRGGAIAIETTVDLLKNAIGSVDNNIFEFKEVVYIDYKEHYKSERSKEIEEILRLQFYKRKSFKHENEYRVLLRPFRNNQDMLRIVTDVKNKSLEEIKDTEIAKRIDINVKEIIKKIYLSPETSKWEEDTIKELLIRLDLDIEIVKSKLYELE